MEGTTLNCTGSCPSEFICYPNTVTKALALRLGVSEGGGGGGQHLFGFKCCHLTLQPLDISSDLQDGCCAVDEL